MQMNDVETGAFVLFMLFVFIKRVADEKTKVVAASAKERLKINLHNFHESICVHCDLRNVPEVFGLLRTSSGASD